jgi:hypothetical protein
MMTIAPATIDIIPPMRPPDIDITFPPALFFLSY